MPLCNFGPCFFPLNLNVWLCISVFFSFISLSNLPSEVIFYTSRVADTLKALFSPSFSGTLLVLGKGWLAGRQPPPPPVGATSAHCFSLPLLGRFTCSEEVRKALSLGQAQRQATQAESREREVQVARSQNLVIQHQVQQVAVSKGDLIAYDEGLAPWSWGSRVSKGFRRPGSSFT